MTCETEQDDNECEKIIHDSIIDMYKVEWQRTHDIESKATGIIGFVGIIFSLTIAFLTSLILTTDYSIREKLFSSIFFPIFIFVILVTMTLSIHFGIKALDVKGWEFLIADKFLDYCKDKKPTKQAIYKKTAQEVTNLIIVNREKNKEIASHLKYSYKLFITSIIMLVIYFIYLLDNFK